ncbi:MAG: tyrosine-type recombinase/integrase [Acetobacteraceae bacterium]
MTLRAIQTPTQPVAADPPWLTAFLAALTRADLAPATRRGYGYDLRHFLAWRASVQAEDFALERLGEYDLIAYRQHLLAVGRRPATINRRLDALRRLCRWAHGVGSLNADVAHGLRPVRTARNRQPAGLTDAEAYALLRAAGASTHGLAGRNYALAQLMLQAGLRVGEVAALRVDDVTLHERSGSVRIRAGRGLKAREVPLNATARRALQRYLDERRVPAAGEPLFLSGRCTAMPVRSIQAVVASLVRRAHIKRIAASAHSLRHTFALGYLRDNPGKLVELAGLLGHDSLDTTAVYTRPSEDDLAADLEHSHLNVDR